MVLLRKFLLSCVRILVTSPSVQGQLGVLILFGCAMVQSLYVSSCMTCCRRGQCSAPTL